MTATVVGFRTAFPEFFDVTVYGDARIQMWIDFAGVRLDPARWGGLLDMGVYLMTAHELALGSMSGSSVGTVVGPATSKSVDKVSVSRDVSSITFADAGHWNATTYGVRFYELVMAVGGGGFQL